MRRARGNTMAFYAMFILLVCVPLIALTWDIGRLRGAQAKLSIAAEAGCNAYANMVDVDAWQTGTRQFTSAAPSIALTVFYQAAPPNSVLNITSNIKDGMPMEVLCTASTTVHPFIDVGLGDYSATVYADAKADLVSNIFNK